MVINVVGGAGVFLGPWGDVQVWDGPVFCRYSVLRLQR